MERRSRFGASLDGGLTLTWEGAPVTLEAVGWVLVPAGLGEFTHHDARAEHAIAGADTGKRGRLMDVVVAGGRVVTPGGVARMDVGIHDEQIVALGLDLDATTTLDASGCLVLPGAVDPHVHLQMALAGRVSTDDFADGTIAAACGGTTTVIDFVDPQPGQGLLDALAQRRAEADGCVAIDYGLHMTIPTWHASDAAALDEIPQAMAAGCATFKLYQAYPRMILDDAALFTVMQTVARHGGRVVLHSETGPVLDVLRSQALAAGHTEPIWHERTRPARLEASAVHRAVELAHLAGCPLHVFHVGCAESVAAVAQAKSSGLDVSAETCPQYLLLTAEEHLGGPDGELYICAPPLRHAADQAALWAALADGRLNMISTDHCPWTRDEKAQPDFAAVPGGVPSIEARLSLVYDAGVATGRLTPEQWVQVCCAAPAAWMGLTTEGATPAGVRCGCGRVRPRGDADDLVVVAARNRGLDTV